jgi:hypothetical protein
VQEKEALLPCAPGEAIAKGVLQEDDHLSTATHGVFECHFTN